MCVCVTTYTPSPNSIREYGSTLYVGMARKKMAAHTFQLQVVS